MTGPQHVRSTDGTRIAVHGLDRPAPPGAPTVLAVHGYPDDHTVWAGLATLLADGHRVVTYDVRGAGASDAPADTGAYVVERLVDDLVAVLDALGADRPVHLLGHDWGSVQSWAALTDARLAGRVAGFTSISGPALEHFAHWLRTARDHPWAAARQAAHSYYTLLFQLPRLPELAIERGVIDRVVGARSHADQRAGLALYRANLRRGLRARPRPVPVPVPVQVLAPSEDPYITVACATQAPRPFVADLRSAVVPGGHWVVREHPERVAGHVRDFVGEVERARGPRPRRD